MTRKDAIAYLTKDGNLYVPCSRYGSDSLECAKVTWRAIQNYQYHGAFDHPIGEADLDWMMGLVVNNHDDVAYILKEYRIPRRKVQV